MGAFAEGAESEIKGDERVVLFPTAARLSEDQKAWIVPVHGWIFEPEEDDLLRGAALTQLRNAFSLEPGSEVNDHFKKRARAFLVDNERGKRIEVRIGEESFALEPSDASGHFRGNARITVESAAPGAVKGWLKVAAVTRSSDARRFEGGVQLIGPTGVSVISDIDDTIKVTEVRDRKELVRNTFLRPFRAAPGMAAVYGRWASAGATFHYVSSSPWQLFEPLSKFFDEAGYPRGAYHLKQFRLKDSGLLKLIGDPLKTKPPVLESLLRAYPKRRFVLVGDSGEKDPEVYGLVARKFPQQVARIYIRNVSDEPGDAERYKKAFEDVPGEKWRVFDEPEGLELPGE